MEVSIYTDILLYKELGDLPLVFTSTKSNFIALCHKFDVNGAHKLTRDSKLVLTTDDLDRNIREFQPTKSIEN